MPTLDEAVNAFRAQVQVIIAAAESRADFAEQQARELAEAANALRLKIAELEAELASRPTPAPEPEPEPGSAVIVHTLAEARDAIKQNAVIIVDGHLKGGSDDLLVIDQPDVALSFADGSFIESTSTASYPVCIKVAADNVTIANADLRGPGATTGIEAVNVRNLKILNAKAPSLGLGTAVKAMDVTGFEMTGCDFPELRRYGVYGRITNGLIKGNNFGPSSGQGTKGEPGYINGEHNVRLEYFENVTVEGNTFEEREKQTLNAKVGKGLKVLNNTFNGNPQFGPLGDGDGLKKLTDPTQKAENVTFTGNTVNGRVKLEMGLIDIQITDNTLSSGRFSAIEVVYDSRYEGHRPVAGGTVEGNRWKGASLVNRTGNLTIGENTKL